LSTNKSTDPASAAVPGITVGYGLAAIVIRAAWALKRFGKWLKLSIFGLD